MPVAVVPSSGVLPDAVDVDDPPQRRFAGRAPASSRSRVSDFTGSVSGMVKATRQAGSLDEDPTNADAYDDLGQVDVHLVEVPDGSTRLVAEVLEARCPTWTCSSAPGATPEPGHRGLRLGVRRVAGEVRHPRPGGRHLVDPRPELGGHRRASRTPTRLATAAVPATDLGNAGIAGPDGPVRVGRALRRPLPLGHPRRWRRATSGTAPPCSAPRPTPRATSARSRSPSAGRPTTSPRRRRSTAAAVGDTDRLRRSPSSRTSHRERPHTTRSSTPCPTG